ncbi:MAG: M48 family metalloprotease, partial [Chthoniobacterales bacterium]
MKFAFLFLVAGLVVAAPLARAQPSPPPAPLTNTSATAATLDPAAATRAWLETVPAEKRAKSDAYFEGRYWLILWNLLLGAAVAIFLLASGLSARMRDFTERITRSKILRPALYAVPYVVIVYLLSFPLLVYSGFLREHAYGLANQSFGPWFGEQLIELTLEVVISGLLMMALYAVFRRAPRAWWLWGSALGVLFLAVQMLISPVFIAPLFNTYKPLSDPKISQPILAMASANQIPVRQVFEVDASRQHKRVSANVSGLFGTTRISLNDNLLKQCTLPEIRAVMAHEMGHYVLNHAFKLILYFGLFVAGAFAFSYLFFERAIRR